jgi:hypothetical protein
VGGTLEGGFNSVVEHFVEFAVDEGLFLINVKRVVLGVGVWGHGFPGMGVFAGV